MSQAPLLQATYTAALQQAAAYPHLRYMGSKYRILPTLADVFSQLGGTTALDPFAGSGVVSYLLKSLGYQVTSSDYLDFPVALARAACVNQSDRLSADFLDYFTSSDNLDGRDFISRTYADRFFTEDDLRYLDAAWSKIDRLEGSTKDLAIAALVLAAARKQPRGVFTVTGLRYDDGRAQLHQPLAEQVRSAAAAWNAAVFTGSECTALQADAHSAPTGMDLVYLDPPYAPPRDDADYLKRYWFLDGLANYWSSGTAQVMESTKTRKLPKRPTAFGSRKTIEAALSTLLDRFRASSVVLSYGSNAVPELPRLLDVVKESRGESPELIKMHHRYHFGTHAAARRRQVQEFIIVAP
ncbi:hypothetical protein GCM10027030_23850 [Luteococcus sediminum]